MAKRPTFSKKNCQFFSEMAFKFNPETLDTTDEVRTKSFQKVPESSQNGKTPP
jgi:hypothetical protein